MENLENYEVDFNEIETKLNLELPDAFKRMYSRARNIESEFPGQKTTFLQKEEIIEKTHEQRTAAHAPIQKTQFITSDPETGDFGYMNGGKEETDNIWFDHHNGDETTSNYEGSWRRILNEQEQRYEIQIIPVDEIAQSELASIHLQKVGDEAKIQVDTQDTQLEMEYKSRFPTNDAKAFETLVKRLLNIGADKEEITQVMILLREIQEKIIGTIRPSKNPIYIDKMGNAAVYLPGNLKIIHQATDKAEDQLKKEAENFFRDEGHTRTESEMDESLPPPSIFKTGIKYNGFDLNIEAHFEIQAKQALIAKGINPNQIKLEIDDTLAPHPRFTIGLVEKLNRQKTKPEPTKNPPEMDMA